MQDLEQPVSSACVSALHSELIVIPQEQDLPSEALKLRFMSQALDTSWPADSNSQQFEPELQQCLAWISERSPASVMKEREEIMQCIEARAAELRASGAVDTWFQGADEQVRAVSASVHGPLLAELAQAVSFHDCACVDMFRHGAPLYGSLPRSGNGVTVEPSADAAAAPQVCECAARNTKLVKRLREDPHADTLFDQTVADAELGRMSAPIPIDQLDTAEVMLASRFSVVQGTRANGMPKVRAVDDETAAGLNPVCIPTEKLKVHGIDRLRALIHFFVTTIGCLPELFKGDIDAAYRRIPIRPEHRWTAWVVFRHQGTTFASNHKSMMFGAVAAVHAWDRVGSLLVYLLRALLKIPALRYVDDFFSADRPECAAHAKVLFARLIRVLLGSSALAEHKLAHGPRLDILGLSVSFDHKGIWLQPMKEKVTKWSQRIRGFLLAARMTRGDASKLAGALSWAAQNSFRRLGRAMLRPLFSHAKGKRSGLQQPAKLCLEWWLEILTCSLEQHQLWGDELRAPVHLFADARGRPPRLAAVLLVDGRSFFSDWAPPPELLECFRRRQDAQIMGLELLAIALGLSTFADLITNRRVFVWSDNTGSEASTRKGTAKSWDHSCVVHCLWKRAALLSADLQVERVPTQENVADLPSREEYGLMHAIGAEFVAPELHADFYHPSAWRALSLNTD